MDKNVSWFEHENEKHSSKPELLYHTAHKLTYAILYTMLAYISTLGKLDPITLFIYLAITLAVIALVISVHEFAHAYTAYKLGDPTAAYQGRLTLNPLAHLDPLGTLAIILVGFGWGKPTPFNPWNLKNPRRDSALISLSGPASNFLLALLFSILFRLWPNQILASLVEINLALGIFNLIPVSPLDGFKVIGGLLPKQLALAWEGLERYGLIILLILIFPFGGFSPLGMIMYPILNFFRVLLLGY